MVMCRVSACICCHGITSNTLYVNASISLKSCVQRSKSYMYVYAVDSHWEPTSFVTGIVCVVMCVGGN